MVESPIVLRLARFDTLSKIGTIQTKRLFLKPGMTKVDNCKIKFVNSPIL
jgi:hypothetical protein